VQCCRRRPARASGALGDFLAAKHHAERRLAELDMPWSILRFGQLTETPGTARIRTTVSRDTRLTLSRDDAALTIVEAVSRSHLARQAIVVLDGDRHVADALDAIPPRPLPPPDTTDRHGGHPRRGAVRQPAPTRPT
jgi:hypothetical protein